ncbi:hypothetical protein AB1Y20_019137 [Prymnesium parvum]|uniref:Uncharacterized protein n=1 Tax=Prymnesium parvum TaxID=97485 RepID=A0AB34JTC1_PRYPA
MAGNFTANDLITSNTVSVWREKLDREKRSQKQWHSKWGDALGLPPRPPSSQQSFKGRFFVPDLPVHGVFRNRMVEATASAMKWDAAVEHNIVPVRPASERSLAAGTRVTARGLAPVRAVSISSSNDRRRDLLRERQAELKEQLDQVERLLKYTGATSQGTINSADWRTSSASLCWEQGICEQASLQVQPLF